MCGSPKAPAPQPVPEPAKQPTRPDEAVQNARSSEKKRARAARGRSSTVITGAGLKSEATTQKKTLLGH